MVDRIIWRLLLAFVLAGTLLSRSASAEHRVALLIYNKVYDEPGSTVDIKAVQRTLERYGFVCRVANDLATQYAFRDTIEPFAASTPTRGTALFYYCGRLSSKGGLLAVDSRGEYPVEKMLQAFATRGGSAQNLFFLDAPTDLKSLEEFPAACQLTQGSTKSILASLDGKTDVVRALSASGTTRSTLTGSSIMGQGSRAIQSSEKFVVGTRAGDEWVNSMGLVFCWCPPGSYQAGSPAGEPGRYGDETQRQVVIKDGFWLSKYELAFKQEIAKRRAGRGTIAKHKLHPITMINHDDAKAMTRNLTAAERVAGRLPTDWQYTLPTEDQWEYAARAGTATRFYFGDNLQQLPQHANFADKAYYDSRDIYSNSAHRTLNDGSVYLAHVGSYQPNPWGFHDIYGNVAEWCINHAIRGGGWTTVPENCRSAYRDSFSSRNEQNFIGYRIVIQRNPAKEKN